MAENLPATPATLQSARNRSRLKFFGIVLVCLAPVFLSYFAYYVWKPASRTNYGFLIEPQRPADGLALRDIEGKPISIQQFRKKFVMVYVNADCDDACAKQLYLTRQVHAMTGRDRERLERLWIIPLQEGASAPPISAELKAGHPDLTIATANPQALRDLLPLGPVGPGAGNALKDHIFLIDIQGNLMMRFPPEPDPYKMKKDLVRLLKATGVR